MERVVVTGLGLATPLGSGVGKVWAALLSGASGIVRLAPEPAVLAKLPIGIAGLVPEAAEATPNGEWRPREVGERAVSRAAYLALEATAEALADARLAPATDETKAATGVAVGTGISDLDEIARAGALLEGGKASRLSPYFVPRILTNMPAGHISIRYGLRGPNHAVSTACTTGAHAIGDAANFIRLGMANAMVAGGTEACVNGISLAGFHRCRALATGFRENPTAASRPFDEGRTGFVMSEGAGILILESLKSARERGAQMYAEVVGYGLSGDGYHLTSPDEGGLGARLCMRRALGSINPYKVGYVNAHATSTPAGDTVEAAAIADVVGPQAIVSSTKGALGHLLGAAGAVEAIFTILALQSSRIPPNLNLERPLKTKATLAPTKEIEFPKGDDSRRYALTNSFGFGGTNASLLFASPPES